MTSIATMRPGDGSAPPTKGRWFRFLTVALLLASGLGMAIPGAYLISLGGSPYYLVVGMLITASAALLARGSRAALNLYGMTFVATVAWSLWEAGLDAWALMPRLVFLAVGGLWLLLPAVRNGTVPAGAKFAKASKPIFAVLALLTLASLVFAVRHAPAAGEPVPFTKTPDGRTPDATDGEWAHYGNSVRGTRYSPLAEITPENAGQLEKAWVYRTAKNSSGDTRQAMLQLTPLMVDGTLYGCTAYSGVFALNPVTGKQVWRYEPNVGNEMSMCRGLAFFRAPEGTVDCPTRLLLGTAANRLIALDAKTGSLCPGFGKGGEVDMWEGKHDFPRYASRPTSPPTIVNGTAIIGASVPDNRSTKAPPGVIRGYDALTGKLKWAFDAGRPDSQKPLPPGETYTPSTPNSWAIASGDEALGLVYLPMGNGSPDLFGGNRTAETEKFSSSVVALDAETGAVRWTFQATRHDLWDYDIAAQPVLTDFPVRGGTVPALILATKSGQVFVLDRRTGKPLTRVDERPVPASDVPGERASPTQPFSVGMPNFAGANLTETSMWGLTPFDQLYCRIKFRQARYEGMYTPPRLGPSIRYPGELGGIDWGSVSVDEGRRVMVVNSNYLADYDELITRAEAERIGIVPRSSRNAKSAPGAPMEGTPYAVIGGPPNPFLSGLGVPCQQPPYGFLSAVDLDTRTILWTHKIGTARNSGPFGIGLGIPLPLGSPNLGGSVTTRGGVIFIAATQDEMFRAFDVKNGKLLWETVLPAAGIATPMTYRGQDGHQYVVIASGGWRNRGKRGDQLTAYRLKM